MSNKRAVNVHAAKTHFSKLLERAHRGETIVVSKAGKPYAKLGPLDAPKKRELGFVKMKVDERLFAPWSKEELAQWETSPLFPLEPSGKKRTTDRKKTGAR